MANDTKYFYNSQHLTSWDPSCSAPSWPDGWRGCCRLERVRLRTAMTDLLETGEVSVCYGERVALDRVTLAIPKGAQVAVGSQWGWVDTLPGRDGACALRAGEILLDGRPPVEYREPVAYVPQREEVDWRFGDGVRCVAMGCYGRGRW